jgi:hypothetical protein
VSNETKETNYPFEFCHFRHETKILFRGRVVATLDKMQIRQKLWQVSAKVGGIEIGYNEFKTKKAAIAWVVEHAEKLDSV